MPGMGYLFGQALVKPSSVGPRLRDQCWAFTSYVRLKAYGSDNRPANIRAPQFVNLAGGEMFFNLVK